MTIYTLITTPASFKIHEISNDEVFKSLTGAVQVQARTGTRMGLTLNWRRAGAELRALRGELAQLKSMRERLWVNMYQLDYVRGGVGFGGPNAQVNGAHSAGATSIALKTLPSAVDNILLPGDFVNIGVYGQLCMVTAALNSSGSTGTLSIWPPLQKHRANNEAIEMNEPGGLFIKTSDSGFGSEPMPSDWFCEVSAEFVQDVLA